MRSLLFAVALFVAVPGSASADVVTAGWNLNVDMNAYSRFGRQGLDWKRGQSFVAEATGTLTSVSFRLYRYTENDPADLRVELYAVGEDGLPIGPALHTESYAGTTIAYWLPALPYTFPFTGERPVLVAGESYAIVLSTTEVLPSTGGFTLNGYGSPQNDYAAGSGVNQAWGETGWTFLGGGVDSIDVGFEVRVETKVATEESSWGSIKNRFPATERP